MTEKAYAAIRAFLQREPVSSPYAPAGTAISRGEDEGANYRADFQNAAEAVAVAIFWDDNYSQARKIDLTVFETRRYGVVHVPGSDLIDHDGNIPLEGVEVDAIAGAVGTCLKVMMLQDVAEERSVFSKIVRFAREDDEIEHFISRVRAAAGARAETVREVGYDTWPTDAEMINLRSLMREMASRVSGGMTSPYGGRIGILCSMGHENTRPVLYPLLTDGVSKADQVSARGALGDLGRLLGKLERTFDLRDDIIRTQKAEYARLAQISAEADPSPEP